MYKRKLCIILVLLILVSSFVGVAFAYQSANQETEEMLECPEGSGLVFSVYEDYDLNDPPIPPANLAMIENRALPTDEQYDVVISTETISLEIQTFENESGEEFFPWELPSETFSSQSREAYASREAFETKALQDSPYSMGSVKEVDVIVMRPNEAIGANENEIVLATDPDLRFLFVFWPSSGEEPKPISGNRSNNVRSNDPWVSQSLYVYERLSPTLLFGLGNMQIAANHTSNGQRAYIFNEKERTGAFPTSLSDLALTGGPTVTNNNTASVKINTTFKVTTNGASQNITFFIYVNGSGNVSGYGATGGSLVFKID